MQFKSMSGICFSKNVLTCVRAQFNKILGFLMFLELKWSGTANILRRIGGIVDVFRRIVRGRGYVVSVLLLTGPMMVYLIVCG